MRLGKKILLPILFSLLFSMISLYSDSLSYDMATGTLTDFNVNTKDNPRNPHQYKNGTEVWTKSGFVGRVVYTGPPTTLSFTNTGPDATGTSNNRFYFTYISSSGESYPGRWSEFFLVLRAKGLRHPKEQPSDRQHDFSGINTVVEHPGETITIPHGAGSEEVAVGEEGYNVDGAKDEYDGSNGYKYKYPYTYIWVDVTLIRPQITQGLWTGYYESEITVSTQSLTSHILLLRGKYGWPLVDPPPFYSFGVTKTIDDPFPFSELEGRMTPTQALKVAEVSYISSETAATIHFAANAAGTSDPFSFHCEGSSFPYYLAFKATNPNRSVEQAAPGQTFATEIEQVWSPIDSTPSDMHVLQGDLKIYLPDNQVQPAEGVYTATVYCFVTPQ